MDAAATGSASSTAVIDQIDHLFQLGHVDGIRIFHPGCYIGDLAGLLIIVDIFRPVPDIMFRRTYGNGCQSGIPHRIRTSIVIFVIACRVIPTLIVGSPVCIGLAAQGHCIMEVFFNPGRIADGCRSLSALFDGGIVPESDSTSICRILSISTPTHGDIIDRICRGIGTDGDGPDVLHTGRTTVVASSGFRPDGDAFAGSRVCLMTDGNGTFVIITIVPGIGFIT